MSFSFTDAWLLHAIHVNERPDLGAELIDIIAYADYINHAVLTYEELTDALPRLLHAGLVVQLGQRLAAADGYKNWWDQQYAGRKRINFIKALGDVEIYLNSTFGTAVLPDIDIPINIQQQDFTAAVEKYLRR